MTADVVDLELARLKKEARALLERVRSTNNIGLPFSAENTALLAGLKRSAPDEWQLIRRDLKDAGVLVSQLDREIDRCLASDAKDGNLAGEAAAPEAEPEPAPEPVDGIGLLTDLVTLFNLYLVLPPYAAETLALWVVAAHALDAFSLFPRVAVRSPTPECGKTSLLILLEGLLPRPVLASNISSAAVFRYVDRYHPSLLIDEAQHLDDRPELEQILNSSHRKKSAIVIRSVGSGDDYEPRKFSTWAVMALAAVGSLPEALLSRSLTIYMARALPGEVHALLDDDAPDPLIAELKRKLIRWAADNIDAVKALKIALPPELRNRRADNWRPLIRVAALAGGPWPQRAETAALAALKTAKRRESPSLGVQLLLDAADICAAEARQQPLIVDVPVTHIATLDLLGKLKELHERPWKSFGRSPDGLSSVDLARLLEPFDLHSQRYWTGGGRDIGRARRGYAIAEVVQTALRYGEIAKPPVRPVRHQRNHGFRVRPDLSDMAMSDGQKAEQNQMSDASDGGKAGFPRAKMRPRNSGEV